MKTSLIELLVHANKLTSEYEWEAAIKLYRRVLAEVPDNSLIMARLADCYFHLGAGAGGFDQNSRQAIEWYQKAIELNPTSAELYYLLGNCYELLELDYKKAVQSFRRAVALNPNYVLALVAAASHYRDPEETVTVSEAINWLERAAAIQPDDGNIYHSLGRAYYETGRYEEAEATLLKALLCSTPLNPAAAPGVGKLLVRVQQSKVS